MRWKILYVISFFAICLIPSAGLLPGGQETSAENRKLAPAPVLQDEDGLNVNFLKDAGTYFEDHFGLRNELVTANAWLMAKVLGVSAEDSVIVGTDDWLYYKDSLGDYQGSERMSERQLFDVAHTLAMVQQYAQQEGISFAFTIAPNKNSLYGGTMPYYYRYFRTDGNNMSRIRKYLEEEQVNYVELYGTLAGRGEMLYHSRDSHWNNQGAAIASDGILGSLEKEHPSYETRDFELRRDFEGDLAAMLYPAAVETEDEVYYDPQPQFQYVEEVESNFEPKISTENAQASGSLVMYRDSFGNALLPYMAEAYANAYFSRGVPYQLSDLVACKADTLVIERAERFLPDMAENAPVMPALIAAGSELQNAKYSEKIPNLAVTNQGVYTKISGKVPGELLGTKSRIYIRVNQLLNYEAFPVTLEDGEEGFELYVVTKSLNDADNVFELYIL